MEDGGERWEVKWGRWWWDSEDLNQGLFGLPQKFPWTMIEERKNRSWISVEKRYVNISC